MKKGRRCLRCGKMLKGIGRVNKTGICSNCRADTRKYEILPCPKGQGILTNYGRQTNM
jgi:hypothetical protein